jgi:hypothetical protein
MQRQKIVGQFTRVKKIVEVMATKDIILMAPNGFRICILEGTELLLDRKEMIANYEHYHFDVAPDEVALIH